GMAADIEPFAANVYADPHRLCHAETPCLACAGLRPQATVRVVTEGRSGPRSVSNSFDGQTACRSHRGVGLQTRPRDTGQRRIKQRHKGHRTGAWRFARSRTLSFSLALGGLNLRDLRAEPCFLLVHPIAL